MGNGNLRHHSSIKKNELMELSKITMFSADIIFTFHFFYQKFCSLRKDDGVIDFKEFLNSINFPDNTFTRHLFNAFDLNCNNSINFRDFIKFFSTFQTSNSSSQTKVTFKLFANPRTKTIDREIMETILSEAIQENTILNTYITKEDIKNIIQETFDKYLSITSDKVNNKNNPAILNDSAECNIKKNKTHMNFNHKRKQLSQQKINPINNISTSKECRKGIENNNNYTPKPPNAFNYEMYSEFLFLNPLITEWMSININKLKSFAKGETRKCCIDDKI